VPGARLYTVHSAEKKYPCLYWESNPARPARVHIITLKSPPIPSFTIRSKMGKEEEKKFFCSHSGGYVGFYLLGYKTV
jgi:hypothetical protein